MQKLIAKVTDQIKHEFEDEGTGHDWWHIHRVVNNALLIANIEGGEKDLIKLSALLHDVGDHKFHKEENAAEILITQILTRFEANNELIKRVIQIVSEVSFKGANTTTRTSSLEAKIVQDADRLDAIGAIGIARAFAYGGNKNRLLFHPEQPPKNHKDFNAYKTDNGHTINHFYEKLLLLKDRMQTKTGRKLAEERHVYMETFLEQFYSEWGV